MVEVFQRYANGNMWLYYQYGIDQIVELASVELTLSLSHIYRFTGVLEA